MRHLGTALAAALAIALAGPAPALAADPAGAPYAGQQARAIKALSEEEIAGLRNGEGMRQALAAELNSYPGPRHVLDLARDLGLSEEQRQQAAAIHQRMNAAARGLGEAVIARERALDALFASGTVTPERLHAETTAIGELQGRLRAVHLAAHIETRAILTPAQIAHYNRLRGYDAAPGAAPAPAAGHRH